MRSPPGGSRSGSYNEAFAELGGNPCAGHSFLRIVSTILHVLRPTAGHRDSTKVISLRSRRALRIPLRPLHSSESGRKPGRVRRLPITDDVSVVSSLWPDLKDAEIDHVIASFDDGEKVVTQARAAVSRPEDLCS